MLKKTEQKVLNFSDRKDLIRKNDKILIALSGGPDSVFLLNLLNKFKKRFKISIGAFHLDHSLRKNSKKDAQFCKDICADLGIDFYTERKNVKEFAEKNKFSIEEAGRIIRYDELSKAADANGFDKIATAHIAGDNAETILLNLIKGTGLKGVSGIPAQRGNIIRPLLCLSKNEILFYLNNLKIKFLTDKTNLQSEFERNYLRNEIIPLLKQKLNPNLDETLFRSSEILRSQYAAIEVLVKKKSKKIAAFSENILRLNIEELNKIGDNLPGDVIKYSIERNFSGSAKFNDIQKIISLLKNERSKSVLLPGGLTALKEKDDIIIFKKDRKKNEHQILKPGNTVEADGKKISIKYLKKIPQKFPGGSRREFISADGISDEFILRKWKKGDRFYPIGMKGSKKVSDFLNDRKLSFIEREKQLVLENQNRIVWIVGLRLDDRFKLTSQTEKVIELCLDQ
jgi:tRNA(Ile)-lysidine synthase